MNDEELLRKYPGLRHEVETHPDDELGKRLNEEAFTVLKEHQEAKRVERNTAMRSLRTSMTRHSTGEGTDYELYHLNDLSKHHALTLIDALSQARANCVDQIRKAEDVNALAQGEGNNEMRLVEDLKHLGSILDAICTMEYNLRDTVEF